MPSELIIRQIEHNKTHWRFHVEIIEGVSRTVHEVALAQADYKKLTREKVTPKQCIQSAFEFLLSREEKESILSEFDVSVIQRFFPDFPKEFSKYLPAKAKRAQ